MPTIQTILHSKYNYLYQKELYDMRYAFNTAHPSFGQGSAYHCDSFRVDMEYHESF